MSEQRQAVYEFGRFRLDPAERSLRRGGAPVPLTPKAFETLLALVERGGRLVGKDELMRRVWPDAAVEENNLNKHISALRKTLGENESGQAFIETVPKHGYRFVADVRELAGVEEAEELIVERHTLTRIVAEEDDGQPKRDQSTHDQPVHDQPSSLDARAAARTLVAAPHGKRFGARQVLLAVGAAIIVTGAASFLWLGVLRAGGRAASRPETTVTRLTNGGDLHAAALSPDGKYFVYEERVGGVSRLWARQTERGNPVLLASAPERYLLGTTFAPDGGSVYFVAVEKQDPAGALYRVPTLGGPQTKLLAHVNSPVAVSPDGKQLAFMRWLDTAPESRLVVASADGVNERTLLSRQGKEWLSTGLAWSPDGKRIAFGLWTAPTLDSEQACRLMSADAQSGALESLTDQRWNQCGRMAWMGNGQGVVVVGTKLEEQTVVRDQVWQISLPGGDVHRITNGLGRHFVDTLGLSADDSALLVIPFNRTSQLWSVATTGDESAAAQITSGTTDGRAGIAPLPDGSVSFVRRTGDHTDIWRAAADGTGQRQLTNDPPFVEELHATPDGRYLVFAAKRDGRSHLFRVDADGANLKQLTGGDSTETDSDASPDGGWLVYSSQQPLTDQSEPPCLWKVSIDGGQPVRLTEKQGLSPHVSPDGKYISYVFGEAGRERIAVMPAEGGTPVRVFDPVAGAYLDGGARFTPDGGALTYVAYQKDAMNVWLQPLDGGDPRRLTRFQSGEIYNYAFSTDGTRLFLARGYDVHDLTLIKNFLPQ